MRGIDPKETPRATLEGIDNKYCLFGLLNAFTNRMQSAGNKVFEEVSWKQWFMLIGIALFPSPPGISDVADIIGTSHQNAKQLLVKLEKAGFVRLLPDPRDSRRTLAVYTDRMRDFETKYRESSAAFMVDIYADIPDGDVAVTLRTILRMEENLRRTAAGLANNKSKGAE